MKTIIRCTDKYSGLQRDFDSVRAASDFTGVDRRIIAKALSDPFNWVHQYGPRKLADGSLSVKRKACPFDFEYVGDVKSPIELWPVDDTLESKRIKSMTALAKFLGIRKQTLYNLRKKCRVGEPYSETVTDVEGNEWLVVFNREIGDFDHSNLKGLQKK